MTLLAEVGRYLLWIPAAKVMCTPCNLLVEMEDGGLAKQAFLASAELTLKLALTASWSDQACQVASFLPSLGSSPDFSASQTYCGNKN